MPNIEGSLFDMGAMDRLALQDTPLHRLDPRVKLITTLLFIVTAVSFDRYSLAPLLPLFLFPLSLCAVGHLPVPYLRRKLLLASPFAVLVGMFNPLLDRTVMFQVGGLDISGGWVSFGSILLRFTLTVSAALVLIASTGFTPVCVGLNRLGVPRAFSNQLLFLYRYIFVLTEEGARMMRARSLRSFNGRGTGVKVYGAMLGQLLLRTMDRAQRIHRAMLCRGYTGEIHLNREYRIRGADILFLGGWLAFFVLVRLYNLPQLLGALVMGVTA